MTYERVYLDGPEFVRVRDGAEVERRPATDDEQQRGLPPPPDPADAITSALRDQLAASLAGNRAFLTLTPPTTAQTVAQVKALSVQHNRLTRLLLGLLDDTD